MKDTFEVLKLPDVEMYGGDTTPWEISLTRKDGTPLVFEEGVDCSATFSITPLKTASGMGGNAQTIKPMFTKAGSMEKNASNGTSCIFAFAEADTKNLRGKFIYQIEVRNGSDLRIGQGSLYIKQNINR